MVDSTYFIAMEYIDGPPLEQLQEALARRGAAMAPAVAAYVCAEILKGLDCKTSSGIKPFKKHLSFFFSLNKINRVFALH